MSDERIIGEAALHAYFDGELEDEERKEVEEWIEEHPTEQVRLETWQRQKAELKRLFDPVLNERVPRRLRAAIGRVRPVSAVRRSGEWLRAVAAFVLLILGGAVGWGLAQLDRTGNESWPSFAAHAVDAHLVYTVDKGRPVEISADNRAQLLKWVSVRLGKPIEPPDLSKAGFKFIGGRIVPADGKPAAQFMYQDRDGRRVTLFLGRNPWRRDVSYKYWSRRSLGCYYWFEGRLGFALSGTIGRKRLFDVSKSVYAYFEKLNL